MTEAAPTTQAEQEDAVRGDMPDGLRAALADDVENLAVALTEAVLADGLGFKGPFEEFGRIADPILLDALGAARRDGAQLANDAAASTIATLRTERDQLAADLRKAREERDAHFMSLAAATCELMRGAHSGGAEIQALRKVCLLQARELKRLDPDGDTPVDLNAAMEKLRAALTPDPTDAVGTAKGDDHA